MDLDFMEEMDLDDLPPLELKRSESSILENFSLSNPIFTEFRTSCSARCKINTPNDNSRL